MKKIFTLGFGVFLMTQISAQNVGFSTAPVRSTIPEKSTVINTKAVSNSNTVVVTEGNAATTTTNSTDAATTVKSDKSANLTTIAISLPGFEKVVTDINSLLNNYSTSTTKSEDKVEIKKLASKYEDKLNAELKKNKSLTETQKTEIQKQLINIQTYK